MFPLRNRVGFIHYDYSVILYPIHFLSQVLFTTAVPLFFLISGYLFFVGVENYNISTYKQKIAKRIKTLFIPYCAWNLFYLIPTLLKWASNGGDYSVWYFLESIWIMPEQEGRIEIMTMATPVDPPLWFVRDLMVCMVVSPIIWYVIKRKWINYLFLLLLAIPWIVGMPFMFPFPGISFCSILFFSLGCYLAISTINVGVFLQNKSLLWGSLTLFCVLAIVDLYTISYQIGEDSVAIKQLPYVFSTEALLGCLLYPMIASRIVRGRSIDSAKLGGAFSVFASHWIILSVMNAALKMMLPSEIGELEAFLIYLSLVLVAFFGGIFINKLLNRNSLMKQLFTGGRD